MVTNEQGGSQSQIHERMDLLPPEALLQVSRVLANGALNYGEDNWRLIPKKDHIAHALRHVFLYLANNQEENHLANASCRLLFALET